MASTPKISKRVRLSNGTGTVLVAAGTGSFAFSGDAASNKLGLHDLRSGEAVIHHDIAPDVPSVVSVAHDASKCAFGTLSGALYVWDIQFPSMMESFRGPEVPDNLPLDFSPDPMSGMRALAWHPRGHVLAAGSATGALTIWDMVLGSPLFHIPIAHPGGVTALAWTAHGRVLSSVGLDGTLKVWSARHGELEAMIDGTGGDGGMWHNGGISCVDSIRDMSRVAISGGEDGSVFLSVLKADEKDACGVFSSPRPHEGASVTCVRMAPLQSVKPMRCASGASDGSIQLFDMDRKLPMGSFVHEGGEVKQLDFNNDGNVLFSAAGSTVKAWDARVVPEESPAVVFSDNERAKVSSFCLANSGASLITGTHDGMLRMYDVRYPSGNPPPMPKRAVQSEFGEGERL